jgi:hypothetical protein
VALIAFSLGVVFFWLAELGWDQLSDRNKEVGKKAGFALVLVVFLAATAVFVGGIWGRLAGQREWWSVQAIDAVTSSDVEASLLGFAAGVFVVWQRARLKRLCRQLLLRIFSAPPPAPDGTRADGGAATSSWLVGAVGFLAVSVVAIIFVFVYFPGHVTGAVSSIKIGEVEARFGTSTAHSARIAIQAEKTASSNRFVLQKWAGVDDIWTTYTEPAVNQVLVNVSGTALQRSKEKRKWVHNFLDAFAVPLSSVMSCFSNEFDPRYSFVQDEAAPVANEWRRFSVEILNQPTQTDSFGKLKEDFQRVVVSVDSYLAENHYQNDYPCKSRWDTSYFDGVPYDHLTAGIDQHLPQIFADGYTMAFIADMLSLTADPDTTLQYLNAAGKKLDEGDGAITGRWNFYSERANALWQSDNWVLDDWIPDVRQARSLATRIADAVEKSDPSRSTKPLGVEEHYRMLVANSENILVYGYVRDWLQGRHRSFLALSEPARTAKELTDWLKAQSEAALLVALNHSSSAGELAPAEASSRLILMGQSYDTLGMFELLSSQAERQASNEHCELALGLLNASKRVFDELRDTLGDNYRALIAGFEAHMNIYESVCSPLTAE